MNGLICSVLFGGWQLFSMAVLTVWFDPNHPPRWVGYSHFAGSAFLLFSAVGFLLAGK